MAFTSKFSQHLTTIDELDDDLADMSVINEEVPDVEDEIQKKMAELQNLMNKKPAAGLVEKAKPRDANAMLKRMQTKIK